jgi:hypothetical protein
MRKGKKMKKEHQEIVARLLSPFGETCCLEKWIGQEETNKADALCKRIDKLVSPSKKAIREGAVPMELSEIELTDNEVELVELIIEKGVYKSAILRAEFSKSIQ